MRCSHASIVTMVTAIALALRAPAIAQVELDLPGPITSAQFDDWVAWLGLDHEQRIATEAAHERYKESWGRFRATTLTRAWEIQEETTRLRAARQRPLADAFADLKSRAWREQQGLEGALFSELRSILPGRFVEIEELELSREWDYIGNGFDLIDLARALPVNRDDIRGLDALLMQARRAVVTEGRQVHEQLTFLYGADERALRKAGFGDPLSWTAEGNEERERVQREAWQSVEPEIDRLEEEFRQLQVGWARRIEAALPAEIRREYRVAWGEELYPDVYEDVAFRIDANLRRHRVRTDLTDGQRREIDALEREFIAANGALEVEYMRVWDQLLSLPDDSDEQKKMNERRWELAKELEDRTQAFRARLVFEIAPDIIDRSFADEDACLVFAMAPEEFDLVVALLGLAGDSLALALGMYEAYIVSANEYIAPFAAQINGIRDSDPRVEAAQRERLRQVVQRGAQALDERFLNDLFALTPVDTGMADAIERLRAAERVNPVAQSLTYPRERIIHPLAALALPEIAHGAKRRAVLASKPWLDSICAGIERRHGLRMERERREAQANFEYRAARDRGEEPIRLDTSLRDWNASIEDLEENIAHACLRMHDSIKGTLSATDARLYEDQWRRIAYPHYSRGPDVSAEVEAALSLRDITPEHARRLLEILQAHWDDREKTFQSLIPWPPYEGLTIYEEMTRTEWEKARLPLAHSELDAIEKAATTLRLVRALLTAEQAAEWDALVAAQRE